MNGISTDINQAEAEAEVPSTSAAAQREKASLRFANLCDVFSFKSEFIHQIVTF